MRILVALCVWIACILGSDYNLVLLGDFPDNSKCLDGSPYGYYFRQGNESTKWIIFHQGGGWCYNLDLCKERATSPLGSSKTWAKTIADWGGIISDNPENNPHFYNWNMVYIAYCDGSSYTSYREDPIKYDNATLYFRGKSNLIAASNDLIAKDLKKATEVIITGCSAGGLATYLHLDWWASLLPSIKVRGISDAGWFLDTNSVNGYSTYTPEMHAGFDMWNSSSGVNQDCINAHRATNDTWRCIMAEYTYPHIKTPVFMLNSKYDAWQMANVYDLPCANDIAKCNTTEFAEFLQYGKTFLSTIPAFEKDPTDGMFVSACYIHCQIYNEYWTVTIIKTDDGTNVTANQAFFNWYYGEKETKAVNTCAYPCNPTCPK